jgi:hypothetical protein
MKTEEGVPQRRQDEGRVSVSAAAIYLHFPRLTNSSQGYALFVAFPVDNTAGRIIQNSFVWVKWIDFRRITQKSCTEQETRLAFFSLQ